MENDKCLFYVVFLTELFNCAELLQELLPDNVAL